MSNKSWVVVAGLGLGLAAYYNSQKGESFIAQSCVVEDTKTVPGMVFLVNSCPFPINVHACKKVFAGDVVELFGGKNTGHCTIRKAESGKSFISGHMYNKNAGWLWNGTSTEDINYMACKAPKSPERTEGNKFTCK